MMCYRLANLRVPELGEEDTLVAAGDAFLRAALRARCRAASAEDGSFLETEVGPAALVLLRALGRGGGEAFGEVWRGCGALRRRGWGRWGWG
jgi:hypothetical protein